MFQAINKLIYYLGIGIIVCLVLYCVEQPKPAQPSGSPEATTQILIKPVYQFMNKPLALNTQYVMTNGDSIRFTKLRWYVGNFTVSNSNARYSGNGTKYVLLDAASTSQQIDAGKYPAGTYSKLEFYLGLDAKTNASTTNTGDLDITTNGDMYWAWSNDYKFFVMEGVFKKVGQTKPSGFVFHVGGNSNLLTETIEQPITVSGAQTTIQLVFDLTKVFNGVNVINLETQSDLQTVEDGALIKANYTGMTSIKP